MKQFDSSIVGQPYSRGTHHPETCGTGRFSNPAHGLCLTTTCALRGQPNE